jgi:Ser/Thr protein kinase RdoA (MazF antagonist)
MKPLDDAVRAHLIERHGVTALASAQRAVLTPVDSATGAVLERIVVGGASYVLKYLTPLGDWLQRATDDRLMREYTLATSGLFQRLPPGTGTAVERAATTSDGGATLLMRDLTGSVLPAGDVLLTSEQLRVALVGLSRLHAAFAGFSAEQAQTLGLVELERWLTPLSPRTARREQSRVPRDHVTPRILPGWAAFADLAPDAWAMIEPLLDDPTPLAEALRRFPMTLVHGDVKSTNLAVVDDRLILLDWSTTTRGPGALDLAWFLCINAGKLPVPKGEAIELYRAERERLGVFTATGDAWERELALALLTSTMRLGWMKALGATSGDPARAARDRTEVAYWAAAALAARDLL